MKTLVIDGIVGLTVNGRDVRRFLAGAAGEEVRVELATVGGSVLIGLEMFNRLRNYQGHVHMHIMSLAASMGSYLSLAGDTSSAEDNAVFMLHNARGGEMGDHNDLRERADLLEGLSNLLANAYAAKSGKSLTEIKELMKKDSFFFGQEMVAAGFVDAIAQGGPTTARSSATNREEGIAIARLAIEDCDAKMKDYAESKEDRQEIAAMLEVQTIPTPEGRDITNSANRGGNSTQEDVMDLQKLKADHPALYAQVIQEGVAQGVKQGTESELARVKGHITMAKSTGAGEYAMECIANGKLVTDQEVVAEYMSAAVNKKAVEARDDDNDDGDLDTTDPGAEAAEATLLAEVMGLSKKVGAAVAPKQEA